MHRPVESRPFRRAALLTLGLLVLTLVPIGRVALCFAFFVKARDTAYVILTGLVLSLLAAGIALGRVG